MNDDMKHKAEEGLATAKEKLGDATDDQNLQAEGEKDKSEADFKQGVDKMKDAFKNE